MHCRSNFKSNPAKLQIGNPLLLANRVGHIHLLRSKAL
jgi:hypothetical protein